MDRGQSSLVKWMKMSAGRQVTYTWGSISFNSSPPYTPIANAVLTTWVGNTLFALNEQDGAAVIHGDRDYLVSVADFQAAFGAGTVPVKGDQIADVDTNGQPITYEAQTPTNEPVWRYSDQTRQSFRIHMKRVM
jgi:hypothetical protein